MKRRLVVTLILTLVVSFGALLANIIAGNTPSLGLDLQGGVSITQEPVGEYSQESLDLAVERITERVTGLGVSEPEVFLQGDAIVVNLPGVKDQNQALRLVQVTGQVFLRPVLGCSTLPNPNVTTTTVAGATSTTVAGATTTTVAGATTTTVEGGGPGSVRNGTPTTTPGTTTPGTTTPGTTTPGTTTPGTQAVTPAGSATTVATSTVPSAPTTTVAPLDLPAPGAGEPSDPSQTVILPVRPADPDQEVIEYCQVGPTLFGPDGEPSSTGEVFTDNVVVDRTGLEGWVVNLELRNGSNGEDIWNDLAFNCFNRTEICPSQRLAIELDGEIISAPTVQEPRFNGNVQVTVGNSESEARELGDVLRSGSLPVVLETQAIENVSPTLGQDSLTAVLVAGAVGIGLVLIFLAFYYRLLGLVVVAGLCVSGALLYSIVSWLSRTQGLALSLAGIAGIVVSVGVTVDSYVVFFERLKDEVRAGRTMRNSAQRAFNDAWRAILVADVVSIIGALVLWWLTVGSVRNFAFFLGLSTFIDLVVSFCFTRPAVLLLSRTGWMSRRKVMGIEAVQAAPTTGASA
jgi:preprotein translocase subunit SecD